MYHAKNKYIVINNNKMHYLTFGTGNKWLILIPGLSLQRFKGKSQEMSFFYRQFAKDYQVLMFDRKDSIEKDYSIEDMADELYQALNKLEIKKADIVGISQGGMIAQILAIKYSSFVNKLVLAMTLARNNKISQKTIGNWIRLAESKNISLLSYNSLIKSYSSQYVDKHKFIIKVISKILKGRNLARFIILAKAILDFDCYDSLNQIFCPTLVIGAENDQVLGVQGARELSKKIPNATYFEFENVGHAAYFEVKEFNQTILNYLITK
ncbi:alpha/beta fold hydrolase [Streptococcus mutans]|uniref:alpha/beta fold hydrolase n=1 Tax=Streptococcus mutans TaxID=1309 RepID=UPI000F6D457D|nr:alpha/beta hydrolase [Streptococcus mutans]MCY7117615.1 alpha/beta hydrolase [Streptococcus mutans]MCY7125224.1 alpha/beta hydrolase [Streptococcus mutans]MDT9539623.1 alpha/beta hydrolase [Streptococcus mutans]NLQ33804.1 alpha/beta hydrolase [Streptococcus mutans]NLQ39471.1 alpha/beta hydrolase [Streptococcus mutans]